MTSEFLSDRFFEVFRFLLRDYRNISTLLKELSFASKKDTPSNFDNLYQVISLDQLEMLEAELNNQHLVSSNNGISLHKIALCDASLWRWKAQRLNANADTIEFKIRLSHYVIYHASKLVSIKQANRSEHSLKEFLTTRSLEDPTGNINSNLKYLDQLSAYILKKFDNPDNRYYQGLNLVLDVIIKDQNPDVEKNFFVLPLHQKDFAKKLATVKQSANKKWCQPSHIDRKGISSFI